MKEVEWLDKVQANFRDDKPKIKEKIPFGELEQIWNDLNTNPNIVELFSNDERLEIANELVAAGFITNERQYLALIRGRTQDG